MRIGFDNEKYQKIQSEHIKERISQFDGKLYLELGGKLFDDHHASRVLPGFMPDSKLRMFQKISDSIEIVIVISATDIEKNKKRADLGITYDEDVLRLRGEFQNRGFMVGSVVITHYNGQPAASAFRQRLERDGIKTYCHYLIEGYPHNVSLIASDEGFGKNDYVETERPLVIVTAPGPGSGKMAVCLSQLYNENKRGVRAGYAKFETFPVWNLPLKHPVNIAYEAATADLNDVNMIDPFHLEAYGKIAINYNRDIEIYPVLNALFEGIWVSTWLDSASATTRLAARHRRTRLSAATTTPPTRWHVEHATRKKSARYRCSSIRLRSTPTFAAPPLQQRTIRRRPDIRRQPSKWRTAPSSQPSRASCWGAPQRLSSTSQSILPASTTT